jgi:hypothetical protein
MAATGHRTRRVIKARRAGRLACGCYVQQGALIVKVGACWVCAACIMAGIAEPDGPWHD